MTANFNTIEIPVMDIDELLDKAHRTGKITRQQRADWIKKVLDLKQSMLALKELAAILGVSYHKIQKNWKRGHIPDALKMGTEDSRCHIDISKQGAIDFILSFDGTDDFDDPRQRKLPFPDK